jgi:transcription initiation factor TFIIIB Brf1 subunit/transcription initiation factor TFIIB
MKHFDYCPYCRGRKEVVYLENSMSFICKRCGKQTKKTPIDNLPQKMRKNFVNWADKNLAPKQKLFDGVVK